MTSSLIEPISPHAEPPFANPFPRVRAARADELDALVHMAGQIHEEYGLGPKWHQDVVRAELERQGKHVFIGVVGDEGRIEGSMVLVLNHLWYNPEYWMLEDRWVYVVPEYRGNAQNIKDMLGFAVYWAETIGVDLCLSIMSPDRPGAKMRFYRKILGEPMGGFFVVRSSSAREAV